MGVPVAGWKATMAAWWVGSEVPALAGKSVTSLSDERVLRGM